MCTETQQEDGGESDSKSEEDGQEEVRFDFVHSGQAHQQCRSHLTDSLLSRFLSLLNHQSDEFEEAEPTTKRRNTGSQRKVPRAQTKKAPGKPKPAVAKRSKKSAVQSEARATSGHLVGMGELGINDDNGLFSVFAKKLQG